MSISHTTPRTSGYQRPVIIASSLWVAADIAHGVWHYSSAHGTAGDLTSDLILSALFAGVVMASVRSRHRTAGTSVLLLCGVYSVLRGITGTFFTDEGAWIHVVLGLSALPLIVVATRLWSRDQPRVRAIARWRWSTRSRSPVWGNHEPWKP